jgi:hypothetical protein
MIIGQEQLYFIRYLNTNQLHGGVQGTTVPRLYQKDTALREAKKINLRTADSEYLRQEYGFVEVIPAFITIGDAIPGKHVINQS